MAESTPSSAQVLPYEPSPRSLPGARAALTLLLAINLFNYVDRYVLAAVEPKVQETFFRHDDPNAEAMMGGLATAFTVTYMVLAPLCGWLADRVSRWLIVGASVILWSLATGASGLALTFGMLLVTRMFVGVGEAGYGPAAPTIISDLYPVQRRGTILAWFYAAIPVGSAVGYMSGGILAEHFGWRAAFFAVVLPGLVMGAIAFFMRDPPRGQAEADFSHGHGGGRASLADYTVLLRTPSYVLNTAGMTAMTFAIGGVAFWMPRYLNTERHAGTLAHVNFVFSALMAVAGLVATLLGGWLADKLRGKIRGAYFAFSAVGIWISAPLVMLMVHLPFPLAWFAMFGALFFLFINTGPTNAALANVTHPSVRATGFALNILLIHLLGDAASPPILGKIGHYSWNLAFECIAAIMVLAGALWLWGAFYLDRDTQLAPTRLANR
jgi:MFS family permease